MEKLVELAKAGDPGAMRLAVDRLWVRRKDRTISFAWPSRETAMDGPKALASLASYVAAGQLSPSVAADVSKVVEAYMRSIEPADHEGRLKALEMSGTTR